MIRRESGTLSGAERSFRALLEREDDLQSVSAGLRGVKSRYRLAWECLEQGERSEAGGLLRRASAEDRQLPSAKVALAESYFRFCDVAFATTVGELESGGGTWSAARTLTAGGRGGRAIATVPSGISARHSKW